MTEIFEEDLKKKTESDDQNFIRKDKPEEQKDEGVKAEEAQKNAIRPEGNQQRNLDRETGGLEAKEADTSAKALEELSKDVWDKRSEEVDQMGTDHAKVFNSTGIRSLIWKNKKKKMDLAKEVVAGIHNHRGKKGGQSEDAPAQGFGIGAAPQQTFIAKMQVRREMKQDGNNKGGGIGA
jgi:hypothetical protein